MLSEFFNGTFNGLLQMIFPQKDSVHYPEHMWVFLPLLIMCLLASYTDFKEHRISKKMVYGFGVVRFLMAYWYPVSLDTILGGFVGFILIFGFAYVLNSKHMAGDIRLSAVIGLWLGTAPMLAAWIIAFACLILGFVVVIFVLKQRKIVPFACCLTVGVVYALLLPYIMGW